MYYYYYYYYFWLFILRYTDFCPINIIIIIIIIDRIKIFVAQNESSKLSVIWTSRLSKKPSKGQIAGSRWSPPWIIFRNLGFGRDTYA